MLDRTPTAFTHFSRANAAMTLEESGASKVGTQIVFLGAPGYVGVYPVAADETNSAYKTLRKGGTVVAFVDLMSLSKVSEDLASAGFKQLRYIQAVSVSSGEFYPSASRIMAIVGVKQGGSTFNTHYHAGSFDGKGSIEEDATMLVSSLVSIHSHPGDMVCASDDGVANILAQITPRIMRQNPPDPAEVEKYRRKRAHAAVDKA